MPLRARTLIVLIAAAMATTPAWSACSNASLSGVFGYSHARLAGPDEPYATVGQITADGKGNLTGLFTESAYGTTRSGTFTGTYSILPNCTGSGSFSDEQDSPTAFNFVLDDSHKGFQMILTAAGTTQPGFGVAQGTVTCGLPGKSRTLAENLFGTLTVSSDPEAIIGQLTLDGKGNISGTETLSVDLAISTATVSGTYTQNSDCTGTAQIISTVKGSTPVTRTFYYVEVNSGKELLLLDTDSGTVVAGNAQE
jgi:hypothetical protein